MSQAPYQNGLTIITPVRDGHAGRLKAVLDEFQAQVPSHDDIPFEDLERVHFIRWVLLPAATDGSPSTDGTVSSDPDGDPDPIPTN